MDLDKLLKLVVEKGASDLFVTAGVPPSIKVNGRIMPVSRSVLDPDMVEAAILGIMDKDQRQEFLKHHELNFALASPEYGRFRVSAFYQRSLMGMVLRRIEARIPTIDELNLPRILLDLVMAKRGLVIMVGATGTGKSTTLAAMIGHRNRNTRGHIISIEDPIEYLHEHSGCIITQREVGIDTESFEVALKNSMRQAPDVIMIGEVRTRETMEHAISFAETGHLCLCTLHANNANQALDRIIHFFPADRHQQLWMDLSLNLKAMVAQQLLPTVAGTGRIPAVEILINTPLVADLVRKGEVHKLKDLMKRSREQGMQTFDQALYDLYRRDMVSKEDALAYADSANDLRLMMKLESETRVEELNIAARNLSVAGDDGDDTPVRRF